MALAIYLLLGVSGCGKSSGTASTAITEKAAPRNRNHQGHQIYTPSLGNKKNGDKKSNTKTTGKTTENNNKHTQIPRKKLRKPSIWSPSFFLITGGVGVVKIRSNPSKSLLKSFLMNEQELNTPSRSCKTTFIRAQ